MHGIETMTETLIIGTGDMAHALCHLFKNRNYKGREHCLTVSKPGLSTQFLKSKPTFHDTGVPFADLEDAIEASAIIIFAVPASALRGLLGKYFPLLRTKVLVDITNSNMRGEDLHGMLGLTETQWVKAFNDNGAVDMLLDQPYNKKPMLTTMCGTDLNAVDKIKRFAEEALGFGVRIVPIDQYSKIAMHQNSVGQDWIYSTYIVLVLFVLTETYSVLRYNVFKGYAWHHLPIQVTNKAICWTSLNAFALCMLPGLLARMYDTFQHTKMKKKPDFLLFGLRIRKALGLLALWFLGLHIIMSLLLFNQKYYGKFFEDPKAYSSKLSEMGEASFFFATFGTGFYIILGVCSLPSVGAQMTSRSWQLVYGEVAWLALLCGTVHVLIMGVAGWTKLDKWPGGMPPITMTSVLIPMLVLFLKLVQKVTSLLFSRSRKTNSKSEVNKYSEISFDFSKHAEVPEMAPASPTRNEDNTSSSSDPKTKDDEIWNV